jgi:hypothetical protein
MIMAVRSSRNPPLWHGEQDQSTSENKDRGGGGALVREKLRPLAA